jgi:FtsZ-interacting cell division protein YlmF
MAGFFRNIVNKISNSMAVSGAEASEGYYEDYYDDDYEGEYYDEQPEPSRYHRQEKQSRKASGAKAPAAARSSSRGSGSYASGEVYAFNGNNNTSLSLHKAAETVVIHPRGLDDAVEIGSHIRSGRMCIVDLNDVADDVAQRIADYLGGNTDALEGAITRVNTRIIAVSPANHRVMPDYREETQYESRGYLKAANDR